MKLPWFPLDVSDYLSDTGHLTTAQHGAYLLLIIHYWKHDSLPEADKQLAAITKMPMAGWKQAKPIIQAFFRDGWKHKRVEEEIAKAKEISGKRRGAALDMHDERRAQAEAIAGANAEQVQTHKNISTQVQTHSLRNFKNLGSVSVKGKPPPRHGASGKGRIYLRAGTDEWKAYADDYKLVTGFDPVPNEHGGKWFKVMGEASPDPQQLRAMRS